MERDVRRASDARQAAELLLSHSSSVVGSVNAVNYGSMSTVASSEIPQFIDDEARRSFCGAMSVSRRTFCLLVTFDLILTFILWGVYVRVQDDWTTFMRNEVENYGFRSSLFDVVPCAVFRFIILILSYAAFRIRNPSAIAITTFVTCAYVVAKIFAFSTATKQENVLTESYHQSVLPYIPLVTSFLIVWFETWFIDFKVLPQEHSYRVAYAERRLAAEREEERRRLLEEDGLQFHTPQGWSPNISHANSPRSQYGTFPSAEENAYRNQAEEAWKQVHRLFVVEEDWKSDSCCDEIFVYSQHVKNLGKVLKLEAYIDASPTKLFEESVLNCQSISSWNPTILDYRILQVIDACTDIAYNVTAPVGRLVSSRDFVTLRHWKISEDQVILSSGCVTTHSDMPPCRQHVRGENRLAGWEFRPVPNHSNRCLMRMIVCTDIKGWIPQTVVDQSLSTVLLDYVRALRKHAVNATTAAAVV